MWVWSGPVLHSQRDGESTALLPSWLGLLLSTRGESGDKTPAACELLWERDAIVLKEFPFSGGPQEKKGLIEKVSSDFMMSH